MAGGEVLRGQRIGLGISQARLAHLLGTQQPNISAYEKDTLEPGRVVGDRIKRFLVLERESVYADRDVSTFPAFATEVKRALAVDPPQVGRDLIQCADEFASLRHDADRAFFLTEPASTSDVRYDALLAGLAVYLSRQADLSAAPEWTTQPQRYSPEMWFYGSPSEIPTLRASAWRDAVPSMRARGVVFSRRNLESV